MPRNIDALTTANLAESANRSAPSSSDQTVMEVTPTGWRRTGRRKEIKEEAKLAALFSEDAAAAADFRSRWMSYKEASSISLSRPYAPATNSSPKSSLCRAASCRQWTRVQPSSMLYFSRLVLFNGVTDPACGSTQLKQRVLRP